MSRKIIHRMSGTPEYKAYIAARQRCTNPKDKRWLSYGARGVKFLFKSVKEFMKAVGPRPSSKHSLDRYPNNDGNYEQGNVRWATRSQQQNNKRIYGKGYSWHKATGMWMARIRIKSKEKYLGIFNTQKEAKEARDRAVKEKEKCQKT
jgi:hypothetical protein